MHQQLNNSVCTESLQPQNQTLLPLQKDQIHQTRILYHRYLEMKRMKLDTDKLGTVKDQKPFQKFDRMFYDHYISTLLRHHSPPDLQESGTNPLALNLSADKDIPDQ